VWYQVLKMVLPHQTARLTVEEAERIMTQRYADRGSKGKVFPMI
jgi:hypothetical protein